MNAFPGYAFAGTAKTDPGFVIAYVDIGPSGASFSVEIESESAERNPTRYAVDNSRDDAATAEDFVATHGAKIFRNHLISVMAEEGRLVFRVAPEHRSANDNVRITVPPQERGVLMTERAPAQLPPADDIAEYEPVETGYRRVDPSPHREPDEAGDTSSMETVQRETARFPETSAQPAVKPKGADSAAQKFDAAAGEMQSNEKPKADILDPAAELPHRTVLFRVDFDQLPIRFPKIEKGHREVTAAGESLGGLNGPEREVGFEPAVWSRNYLDFGEAEIDPVSDGMPEDILPAATSSSSENGYEDQRLTSAESGDYH